MKNLKSIVLSLFAAAIIISCSTGKSAFNKGNYYDATLKAIKTLRVKPDSKKALEVVQQSYPMAIEYYRQKVDAISNSNHPDKYLQIVESYSVLNDLADEVTRCPAALEVLKPVVYFHDQQKKAERLALKEQYENALNLLESQDVNDARLAFNRLQWIAEIDPTYANVEEQMLIAKDLATFKVVVEFYPEVHSNYAIDSRVFYERLYDRLVKRSSRDFLRFYKPEQAQEMGLSPHEVVKVQFLDFNIGTVVEKESSNTYKSDSIVVGSYSDNDGIEYDVYGTVEAEATVFEREVVAKGVLDITIVNFQTNEIIRTQKYPDEYYWRNQWATFNGDKRAVPGDVMKLTKEKQRVPPSPQEMFLLYSDRVFDSSLSFLHSFYRKR